MYKRARKRHWRIYEKTAKYSKEYKEPSACEDVLVNCRYLHNSGGFVPHNNTDIKYFPSATRMFDDVIQKLKSAQKFVFIEYFAISDGVLLQRILNVLLDKMKKGVDVRIIYDDMGSRALSLKTKRLIKKAGGQIRVFNRLMSKFSFALNYRDHRKIIVIDGKVAYTGGCNLADEYINEKRMHGYWKDAGLRMCGEVVDEVTLTFLRQWEFILKKPIEYQGFLGLYDRIERDSVVLHYVGGPEFEHPICKSVYENVICCAKKKLYIMTPYFVPDESIMQDIINAALAGVDVRLVLPAVPDKMYVYLLTRDNAEKMTKYGVKVYYVEDAFVHSKVVLSESCAVIGSVNFDMRSFYQQFENSVLTDDKKLLSDVENDFERTFADCKLVEKRQKRGLFNKIAVSVLRIVGPLM
jgi:cardiolipin synthase